MSGDHSMQIQVNGNTREISTGATIAQLLQELEVTVPHVAVELNLDVVPRAQHDEVVLNPGDQLEIVTLVGGG